MDAHRVVELDSESAHHVVELRVGADAGAATRELVGVALEHRDVPADLAEAVRGEQAADRAADDERAIGHDVMRSSSATCSGDSRMLPALTFCSTCSGVLAPAMTLAVTGFDSSQPNARSSMLWLILVANS